MAVNSTIKYTFTNWSPKIEKANKNTTYFANYEEDEYFVVTFETHLGTPIPSQLVKPGETVKPPERPERGMDVFTGWNIYDETEGQWKEFDFNTKIDRDITLFAAYQNYVLVYYNSTGGNYVKPVIVKPNEAFAPPKIPPTKTGCGFASWQKWDPHSSKYEDFNFNEGTASNIVLFAKWNVGKFKITFESKNDYASIQYNEETFTEKEFEYSETPYVFEIRLEKDKIPDPFKDKIVLPRLIEFKTGDGIYPGYHKYVREDESILVELDMSADVYIYAETESKKSLNQYSWHEIDEISKSGNASIIFNVGDTKNVRLFSSYAPGTKQEITHRVRIIDFDHDELATSTKENPQYAGITFEFADLITEDSPYTHDTPPRIVSYAWNAEHSLESDNYDYINHSYMNWTLNPCDDERGDGTFYKDMLPDEFMRETGLIKQVKKLSGVNYDPPTREGGGGYNYEATEFYPYFFLLSVSEMTESDVRYIPRGEGTTYKFYQGEGDTDRNRRKNPAIGNVYNNIYWTRTPSTKPELPPPNEIVFIAGGLGDLKAGTTCCAPGPGFAPAFCI